MSSGSRKPSPKMTQPRTRASADAPRHVPRTMPQNTHIYTQIPNMSPASYHHAPIASGNVSMSSCIPLGDDAFYHPGNDGSYIPASNVAPTALTFLDTITPYDIDTLSRTSSSSLSSTLPSPPMTEAEIFQSEFYPTTDLQLGIGHFASYPDPWVTTAGPPTPPEDLFDMPDMFCSSKNDNMAFPTLPEPATECEYLGVSALQFARPLPRNSQPRPIRSASERTPPSSASGSPKDEPIERTRNNPRSDRRYDAKPDADGYYHCPYAASENCNHKPTKQKCIYAKNLDSHLKPYTCKHTGSEECRTLRFSSNACLFRHEREMHGLHNHGMNPYLCKFEGCERSRHDNGFPRRWNQRDHMKRVHGWEERDNNDVAERGYDEPPRRRRGNTATGSVPMKRNGSARSHPYLQVQSRTAGAPRYMAHGQRELQAPSHMNTGMTVSASHYSSQPMMAQGYAPIYIPSQY